MTKLLIEKITLGLTGEAVLHNRTGKTMWKVTAWYGENCWHVAFMQSLPAAMKLAAEWVEGDAVHN